MSEANRLRILYFLVFCCTASWLPLFADYLKERRLTGLETGAVLSVAPFMMFAVQPFYGMLADRLGYRRCFLLSSGLAGMSYGLYLMETGFAGLFAITVFMSLFYNALQPILDSLSLRLSEREGAFSYGTLRIAGAAGWSFTGIVVGQMIEGAANMRVIFACSAGSMLLAFLFALSLPKAEPSPGAGEAMTWRQLRLVLSNRRLILLLVSVFLVSVGSSAIWYFYSIYMKENGASASLVGYALSFQGLCELPFFYFSARIIGRFGLERTLVFCIFVTVVRLLLYAWVRDPQLAVGIEVLQGISWSLYWVACVECVNSLVSEAWRATGQSLLYAAYLGIGAIVGNLWTGLLADSQLRISDIYLLNAGIVGLTGVLTWLFLRKTPVPPA